MKDLKDIWAGGQFHSNWLEIKCYGERPPLTLHHNTMGQMSDDCAQLRNLQVSVWGDSLSLSLCLCILEGSGALRNLRGHELGLGSRRQSPQAS